MGDALGQLPARDHFAEQQLVAFDALLGGQAVFAVGPLAEGVARAYADHVVAAGAQRADQLVAEPGFIAEHEPGVRRPVQLEIG